MLKGSGARLGSALRRLGAAAFSGPALLPTNVALSVGLSGLGDVLQQKAQRRTLDEPRLARMTAAGLPCGVVCHFWYQWLDRLLPGTAVRTVTKKVVWDQVVLSPVMWSAYFAFLAALEGKFRLDHISSQILDLGGQLYAAEWLVWPPAQAINFYFLPTRFRVLYDNGVSLAFDVYTSYLVNDQKRPDHKEGTVQNLETF